MNAIYTVRQFFIAIIITILVVGGAGYYLGRSSMRTADVNVSDTVDRAKLDLTSSIAPENKNAVMVNDQSSGSEVVVSQVSLEKSSWVAIHEDNAGKPGNILGARRYPAGSTSATTTIELLRLTVKSLYYAMIHEDTGDAEFDYQKDLPLIMGGHPVMMRFVVGGSEEL